MSRFRKQAELGLRWVTCGWRLFRRNFWLLTAMGAGSVVLLAVLASIPIIGAALAGALVPALVTGLYLALDATAGQPRGPAPRAAAAKGAPRALVAAFLDEERLIPIVLLSLLSMALVLLTMMAAWQLMGSAWWVRSSLDAVALVRMFAAALLALAVGSVGAAAFVYGLPLAFLQQEPLLPALWRSLRAAARHAGALVVLEALLLLPLALGAAVAIAGSELGYVVALIGSVMALPLTVAGLYCSYRTLFPVSAAEPAAVRTAAPKRRVPAQRA